MTGGTSKIGLLDTVECAGNKARNWTGSRHVPIRHHRSCACRPRISRLGRRLAHAQQAPLVGIEPIRATLDQIETQTRRSTLRVNALTELAQRISPLRDDLRDKLADLEPRLADVDARLKGLGAAPAPPATEDPAIATERARLTQSATNSIRR